MASFRIGKVNNYYAKMKMMAVDLSADLYLKDKVIINNQESIIKEIKIGYEKVESARKGETVVINADFPVAIGDELVRT